MISMRMVIPVLILCLSLAVPPPAQAAEGRWYLRVIARDDSREAQEEKLRVRNAVLAVCPARTEALAAALPMIHKTAEKTAPCRVSVRIWRPNGQTPPAPTIYITVGEGAGRNWWGVLYDNAVLLAQAEGSADGPAEEIEFVWPLWEWLKGLLGWK